MLRRLQALLVSSVCAVAIPAGAQEPTDDLASEDDTGTGLADPEEPGPEEPPSEELADEPMPEDSEQDAADTTAAAPDEPAEKAEPENKQTTEASEPEAPPTTEGEPFKQPEGWRTELHGYFRAPMAMGFSPRPNPETCVAGTCTGADHMQVSYGPTRTVDTNYYSFAYTRLQEQDWAEVTIHAKKKHVDAAVGWMGYWYQGVGFRNSDAAWAPGLANLTLDTDIGGGPNAANVAVTMGAFWPGFGYFEKYDTYTLGRFRQLGEQVTLKVPIGDDLAVEVVQGFGTSRDGSFNNSAPAPFQGVVGLDLMHWENLRVSYDELIDVGLHYNREWSRDPFLWQNGTPGKSYRDVRQAHLTTVGGEVTVSAPYAGSLWVSPSYIKVRNGWALDWAGTEVMHAIGGAGIATNYMAFTNNPPDSTGTGTMRNVGFLYENTVSNIQGEKPATTAPEVTLNVFGLFTDVSIDLPETSTLPQNRLGQLKYGADVEYQALDWLAVMLRYDEVNYNLDHGGYVFSAISPRLTLSSHFLSGESIYFQYSRYRYGENMTIAGKWPWGAQLIAGSDQYQGGSAYAGKKPDMDVVRLQATISF